MPERLLFAINGNGESRLPTFPAMRSSPSSRQWPFILNGYFLAISLRIESALQVATHGTETGERSAKEHNGRTTIRDISSSAFFKERPLGKPVSQEGLSGLLAARGVQITQTGISKPENQQHYVVDYEALAIAKAFRVSESWLHGKSTNSSIGELRMENRSDVIGFWAWNRFN